MAWKSGDRHDAVVVAEGLLAELRPDHRNTDHSCACDGSAVEHRRKGPHCECGKSTTLELFLDGEGWSKERIECVPFSLVILHTDEGRFKR